MNILIPLKRELIEQQPWLFQELNFKIVDDAYSSECFGNSLVTLESPSLRVQFIRDKWNPEHPVLSRSTKHTAYR